MKKNIIVIILTILVLGLAGYIVYDKVLSTDKENNNYQENNNNNQNQDDNNNNNENQDEIDDIYRMENKEIYIGCGKKVNSLGDLEYDVYELLIKDDEKCIYWSGGTQGMASVPGTCTIRDSYMIFNELGVITLYFKTNSDGTLTYQNTNVVMKKVEPNKSINYENFCKNNY